MMEKDKKEGKGESKERSNQLKYINNFPLHWKYVSIFGGAEGQSNENIEQRDLLMKKVLGLSAAKDKKRQQEMLDADIEDQNQPEEEMGGRDSEIF